MNMKKLISASVAGIMAIGLLAGCGGSGSNVPDLEKYTTTDEKLTLNWLGYPTNDGASEGTVPELTLEEKFNVEIKPMFYAEAKYQDNKMNLMASGQIPDLIYELDPMHVFTDAEQECIVPVPYETIKEYAPEYYAYLNEYVPVAWIYSRYEDQNYGVPNYSHAQMINVQAVYRGDWLKKFNLDIPVTIDEFEVVMDKFSNGDPDGNGKDDTYGISVGNTHYQHFFSEIFGAYGVLPFDWQIADDGSIVYGGMTDECKQVLQLLADWNKKGYIHPDFLTGGAGTSNAEKFTSGQLGYFYEQAYFNDEDPNSLPNVISTNFPGGKVAIGQLPEGPEGDHGRRAWGRASHVVSFGRVEGHGVKVPRVLQILEGLFTDFDLYKTVKVGNEGEHWQALPADTKAGFNFDMTPEYGSSATRTNGFNINIQQPSMFTPIATSYDNYMTVRSENWKKFAAEYVDESYCLTDAFFKVDIVPSGADLLDLRNAQMSLMNEIIAGTKTVDDYAEFENRWNNGGGANLTAEANEIATELDEIGAEIGVEIVIK